MKIIQLAHRTVDELLEEIFAITNKQKIDTNDRRVLYAVACAMKNRYEADVPKWIPVSERLPRDGSWNIFTDGKNISVERYKADAIDHFFPNGRWFELEDVIAWMPLPEAYNPSK